MTRDTTAPVPSTSRPPLPPEAGVHTRQLEIAQTRDELAATLDDLSATFNPAVQIRSHPVLFAALFLGATAAAAAAVLNLRRGRADARRSRRGRADARRSRR